MRKLFALFFLFLVAFALPKISISRETPPPKTITPFSTNQELFGFKPSIQIRKLTQARPPRLLADRATQAAHPQPRKLPLAANPPPGTYQDMLVMPTSIPQISAPRMVLRNFPKPTETDYLLSNHRNVEVKVDRKPSDNQASFQSHALNIARKLGQKSASRKSKSTKNRRLTVKPFLNLGTGFVDIGSHGYSKLSYALMNPEAASMGPFVPHTAPPPPVRLQLMDPAANPESRKSLLPDFVRDMFNQEVDFLKSEITMEINRLNTVSEEESKNIADGFQDLEVALGDLKAAKDAKANGSGTLDSELEKKVTEKIEEFKKMAIALKNSKTQIEMNYAALTGKKDGDKTKNEQRLAV